MIQTRVKENFYQDSVKLMRIASSIRNMEGVEEASVSMATPTNLELLERIGILTPEAQAASPDDILIVVRAASEEQCHAALEAAETAICGGGERVALEEDGDTFQAPKSLERALDYMPEANIALISVPGKYAFSLADQALDLGVNPMIFSDNVSVEEERTLKKKAVEKGLIVMGPDCGTCILDGACLGFGNQVRRGPIGIVGAAGTGIQELACLIHQSGGGISHAIGTGGRDLSRDIGGISMLQGLECLARDESTQVILLLSKPADPAVADHILERARQVAKPVIVCFLGGKRRPDEGNLQFADTMDLAADLALRHTGRTLTAPESAQTDSIVEGKHIRALYTGGSLAYEALYLFREAGVAPLFSNIHMDGAAELADPMRPHDHTVLDLGDDVFTVGRAHPMINPELRNDMIAAQAAEADTAVLLLDFVLGYGCHPDPVGAALPALEKAFALRPDGRLRILAHVCGADSDPQDLCVQEEKLLRAGVQTFRSNADMVRAAIRMLHG